MSKRVISAYTPSNTDAQTRERIFVQRHNLLKRVVRWSEESMLTGNKHHLLFIGPRGSGKTHLVSMVQDRLLRKLELVDKMRIAWLGEDSVFTGLIDVAVEIADELASQYPDEFRFDYRSHAKSLVADEAAESILDEVIRRLGDKSILLIMENLDRAFHGLGDTGQKKWRAFLQETGRIATVATSQQLFEDISSRDAAFYGFFEIFHLEPLAVEDAWQLMANIARENNNTELLQFLATSEGRYRVRALQHLAGGNHRMYVMLSEFLTQESLDGLVAAFEELAEDLTPYFQERVRSLSPQQARIVQSLCNASGAITVKAVAADTFIAERNVSKQLGELKQKGYVVSDKRGKESYYEMAEPLMRLCLEVKKQRGKPLQLVAAFLRAWYSANSIHSELQSPSADSDEKTRAYAYKQVALQSSDLFQDVIRQGLDREFETRIQSNDFAEALSLAEELEYADRPRGLIRKSEVLRLQGQFAKALNELNAVLSLPQLTIDQKTEALLNRGDTYSQLGDSEKAIADYSAVIEMAEAPVDVRAHAMNQRGNAYWQASQFDLAENEFTSVSNMTGVSSSNRTDALFCIPEAMIPTKPMHESIAALKRAFDEGDSTTTGYGGAPRDILKVVLGREPGSWPEFVKQLVPIYAQYGALDRLGSGLTESIAVLDAGGFSESQLDVWNAAWQKFGAEYEEFSIPLAALDGSIQVIKTGDDRPLFNLPLEIRKIVQPLLKNTLSNH